jgi:hypothetical protein
MPARKPIKKGTRVLYWQPGVDAILASWSGKRGRPSDGTLVEATIAGVATDETGTYYTTETGMMLMDSDIREVL